MMWRSGAALQSDSDLVTYPPSDMATTQQVAAYCRVSTLEQKKKGLGMDIQLRDVTAFAATLHLVIDRFYRDEAQSGAAENRRQLNKLLRACERREITTVIIPSLDRLSRNVRIAENLFHRFDELGVNVRIVDMPGYDGRNRRDVMIRQIREAIAEDSRKEIIERLWKGRQERVRKGKTPGGNAPYGYRRVNKKLVEETREAEIVRLIFQLADDGNSAAGIARLLAIRNAVQRNGQPWSSRQVLAILSRRQLYEGGKIRYGEIEGINPKLVLIERNTATHERQIKIGAAL
jgi:site-specific DNA recombinase